MAEAIHCVVVTPEDTALDENAEFVVVPMIDDEAGIGKDHAPMIGRLGCGEVRIRVEGKGQRFFVDGGFVQVDRNEVSVITEQAIPASDLNVSELEAELKEAEALTPASAEDIAARSRKIVQAKAKLKVASKRD